MTLDGALSIATGGLANVNRQMALVSQNVANASTPGYATQIATQHSVTADGQGLGVHSDRAIRNIDTVLQAELFGQNATVAGLQTRREALQAIDSLTGTPGQGTDIASLLGRLQDQFSTLLNGPDSPPQQSQVVSTAVTLTQGINALSGGYTAQRQAAQDAIVADVTTLNTVLATISGLTDTIITLKTSSRSTADLENQRDAALADLSQLLNIKVMEQPNGDLLIGGSAGLLLPIHGVTNPFAATGANVQPGAYYPGGGITGVTLGGTDVTRQLVGGRIGANIALRDVTLPTEQAELDEFSQNLASRFAAQGLALFTDPLGNVPAIGVPTQVNYVGFASTIQVNPAVQATASLVRDGTAAVPTGLAGFTGIIQDVLTFTFGANQAVGVPQPLSNTSGLGAAGNLRAPYVAPLTLAGIVTTVLASQAQESATASAQSDTEQAVQTSLAGKLSARSGVNMDTEMSHMIQLQNAYGANARVMSVVQAMWSQLLQSVR
ncbi:MAG: flagellar hook-associated protein FlgK [Acetobacteraceae bacterium]